MKLQTRILLAGGCFRYGGTAVLMFLGLTVHPVHYFLGTAWLVACRRILHRVLLPPFFSRTQCANCRQVIPLRSRWKCKDHYTDHKVRHVLSFHCNKGHEIASFDCPTETCGATIDIQKASAAALKRAVAVNQALLTSGQPAEKKPQPHNLRGLLIGYDRRYALGWFARMVRKSFGMPIEKAVSVFADVFARHVAILGGTGMGKSTLILNLARQVFERGDGATFLDPTGDLADDLLQQIPPGRIDDVLYINVSDRKCPFPFNLLHTSDQIERSNVVDELIGIVRRLSQHWGDTISHQLSMALNAVLEVGGSLQDVYDLFTNAEARHRIVRKIKDQELKEYWTETFPSLRYDKRLAVITKLRPIVKHELLGPILCAAECAFDADEIIRKRKIVIVNLATGSPADYVSTILGTFAVRKILAAVYRQKSLPREHRIRHFFFVDEFQNFMHRASAFDRILSEVRKYKLVLIVANQFVAQLEEKIRAAIFGNVGCLCVFRLGHQDAKVLKDEFDGASKRDLTVLSRGECLVRIGTHCLSVRTPPPPPKSDLDPTAKIVEKMHALIQNLRGNDAKNQEPSDTAERTRNPEDDNRASVLCEFA